MKNFARFILAVALLSGSATVASADSWGLVNMSVACVREKPSHTAELGSQVLMGTPVRVTATEDGWCRVETPDGYKGYIIEHSLQSMTEAGMDAWRRSPRVTIISPREVVAVHPDTHEVVTDLVAGCLLQGSFSGDSVRVTLPDGRIAMIPDDCVMTAERWAAQEFDADRLIQFAVAQIGRPYLWGGTSTKAMDCSGLTQLCYYVAEGVILPRNASQQARVGSAVPTDDMGAYRRGDLITFGNPATGRVTHVAIYDSDGRFVHSSGRVKRNSLDKDADDYLPLNRLNVRRVAPGFDQSDGIVQVYEHPWYFDER